MNVSHFGKICQVLTILHQLICRSVANFGTRCRVEDGGSNSRGCFGIMLRTNTSKLTNVIEHDLQRDETWSGKVRCLSEMKLRLLAQSKTKGDELPCNKP